MNSLLPDRNNQEYDGYSNGSFGMTPQQAIAQSRSIYENTMNTNTGYGYTQFEGYSQSIASDGLSMNSLNHLHRSQFHSLKASSPPFCILLSILLLYSTIYKYKYKYKYIQRGKKQFKQRSRFFITL